MLNVWVGIQTEVIFFLKKRCDVFSLFYNHLFKKKKKCRFWEQSRCLHLQHLPSVHIQIHPFRLLEPAEVGSHLCLLHGLALQVAQALHKLNALVIFATHKRLFCSVQIQFLKSCFSEQAPILIRETVKAQGELQINQS